ncbi:MAG: NAD(P)/FAD-dependent oxidoreductase, partial [Pyrinomonadaceae bacterium]
MDRRFDFLVIGGGVIGLSIARELHRSGARKITIIEKGEVGREASWAAAGMLSPNIETNVGTDLHRLCRESLELYPSFAEQLSDETGVGIELNTSGTFEVAFY